MKNKKYILKKESFGGTFADNTRGGYRFLQHEDYEKKKKELMEYTGDYKVKFIDVTERGYPLLVNSTSSPNNIFWEITKKCNAASCIGCFMDSNSIKWPDNEVKFKDEEKIIRQFSDLGGSSIRITGGEPTDKEEFFDIVDLLSDEGIITGLNTNGLFDEKKLERILSSEIKDMRISLDGPRNVNDSIRGQGSYDKAAKTIAGISAYNITADVPIQLTINFVLMQRNMKYIEEMIELAQSYNSKISFGLLRLSGRARKEEMLSPEDVVQAAYRVQKMRSSLNLAKDAIRINYDIFCEGSKDIGENSMKTPKRYAPYPFDNSKCPLGSAGFTLDAYARVTPCGYLVNSDDWVGESIIGKDMLYVWHNSSILNKARKISRQGCTDCGYHKEKCNGGCPAMSYFITRDPDGKDPYCVRDVDIKNIITDDKK
jgi:radical SAM protein with 4Fe4S-binding SPASM domain